MGPVLGRRLIDTLGFPWSNGKTMRRMIRRFSLRGIPRKRKCLQNQIHNIYDRSFSDPILFFLRDFIYYKHSDFYCKINYILINYKFIHN